MIFIINIKMCAREFYLHVNGTFTQTCAVPGGSGGSLKQCICFINYTSRFASKIKTVELNE